MSAVSIAMPDIVMVNPGLVLGSRARDMPRAAGAPQLSHVQVELLQPIEVTDETGARSALRVPIEHPLRVIVDGREIVTLMTLAAAPELLTVGYLLNQRTVQRIDELISVDVAPDGSAARVMSRSSAPAVAGIGLACALGSALDGVTIPPLRPSVASHAEILRMLEIAREHDAIHRAAGSVHSAILFDAEELLIGVEDVSRHNGVDTLCGWLALHALPGAGKSLFTTGRLTAEMVLKAAFHGISTLISRNGTTAAGCAIATQLDMTLIGRAANRRYIRYAGR